VLPGPVGPVELLGSPRGLGGGRCCFLEGDAADTRMKAAAGKRGGWCRPQVRVEGGWGALRLLFGLDAGLVPAVACVALAQEHPTAVTLFPGQDSAAGLTRLVKRPRPRGGTAPLPASRG
jgi:hypothetical protein